MAFSWLSLRWALGEKKKKNFENAALLFFYFLS